MLSFPFCWNLHIATIWITTPDDFTFTAPLATLDGVIRQFCRIATKCSLSHTRTAFKTTARRPFTCESCFFTYPRNYHCIFQRQPIHSFTYPPATRIICMSQSVDATSPPPLGPTSWGHHTFTPHHSEDDSCHHVVARTVTWALDRGHHLLCRLSNVSDYNTYR
jgi:hypothetical protein